MLKRTSFKVVLTYNMNVVICDDQRFFVNQLEGKLKNYSSRKDLNLRIQKCYSAQSLLSMNLFGCDVLFLDIDMPGMNGLDAAKELRKQYPDMILVFITGWVQYAPAGYRVNAFRYLLKEQLEVEFDACMDEVTEKLHENAEVVTIYGRDRTLEVSIKNILYFEGTPRRYTLLHLYDNEACVECTGKLSDYDAFLASKGFLRLQKSYLANMEHIIKIKNYTAFLRNGKELKVSERQYAQIRKQFLLWKGHIL